MIFAAALAVAVVVLTSGHGPTHKGLSEGELRWVHAYGGWWASEFDRLAGVYDATTGATSLVSLVRPYAELRGCLRGYRRAADDVPGSLSDIDEPSVRACTWAHRAGDDFVRRRYPPSAKRMLGNGVGALVAADRALVGHLVLERDLPEADEPTTASRVDARYSAAATDVVAFNLEVRCWDREDWAAIRRETAALGVETSRKFFGAADAFEGVATFRRPRARSSTGTRTSTRSRRAAPPGGGSSPRCSRSAGSRSGRPAGRAARRSRSATACRTCAASPCSSAPRRPRPRRSPPSSGSCTGRGGSTRSSGRRSAGTAARTTRTPPTSGLDEL